MQKPVDRLLFLCETIPPLFLSQEEAELSRVPLPGKWSKKQILGHLIDSATNNHHRFVRGQFENEPQISYDQEQWNKHGYYNSIDTKQLILMWETYNRQLAALISSIPVEKLLNKVRTGEEAHTLKFLIDDYVVHLEHHLKQLVNYK